MTTLRLNREFFVRHLGVAILFFGMACWFGYDGYVAYPQRDDAWFEAQHLRRENATRRQKEFMVLAFLAAAAVGGHLWAVSRLRFSFDDEGYVHNGRRTAYGDIKTVDRSKWEKKGIVKVDGVTLDAWHHVGVREFEKRLRK